jgi:hypothetical protein
MILKFIFSLTTEALVLISMDGAPLGTPDTIIDVDADRRSVLITVSRIVYDNEMFSELPMTIRLFGETVVDNSVSHDSPNCEVDDTEQFHTYVNNDC